MAEGDAGEGLGDGPEIDEDSGEDVVEKMLTYEGRMVCNCNL